MVALPDIVRMAAGAGGLLAARDPTKWKNPHGEGNMDISISGETINWGNHPPVDIINVLRTACHANGCDKSVEIDTFVVTDKKKNSRKLRLEVLTASFPSEGPGGTVPMLDALDQFLRWDVVLKKKNEPWRDPGGCPNFGSMFCNSECTFGLLQGHNGAKKVQPPIGCSEC
jgi:hypothetical protein